MIQSCLRRIDTFTSQTRIDLSNTQDTFWAHNDPSATLLAATTLAAALNALHDRGIALGDVGLRRPTLDDVFLTLTGHAAEVETVAEGGA